MKDLPLITSVFLTLTEKCNLACEYCFVNHSARDITYEIAKDSVDFLVANAKIAKVVPSINFFGGEPLLKWNEIIVPLTLYIREELKIPFRLSMTSNCLLMTREKLEFMKKYNIGLLFSFDGDKETQDINRPLRNGMGSFDLLKDKIPMILEYYPSMTFRATISNLTVQHTFDNMMFAVNNNYDNLFFIPNVFAEWTDEQKQHLKTEIHKFSDFYIERIRQGNRIRFTNLEEQIRKITAINSAICNMSFRKGFSNKACGKCGLGATRHGAIGVDGKIYGCQEMVSNKEISNVFEIGDIYNGIDHDKRANLVNKFNCSKIQYEACKTCKLAYVCDGGCVANNFIQNGDINKMTPMLCFYHQVLLEEAIYICNVLGKERNSYFKRIFFGVNGGGCYR